MDHILIRNEEVAVMEEDALWHSTDSLYDHSGSGLYGDVLSWNGREKRNAHRHLCFLSGVWAL